MASDPEKQAIQSPVEPNPIGLDEISASTKHRDDNYELYKASRDLETDPSEVKRVLRKVDFRIVPILVITYMLQYLDKNSINFASVYGLKDGTHLEGQDYAWLGSIFYFGYLFSQFPSGYLLQRLPIGKFLSLATICWGIILITTPACTSFAGIATNRFLLGALEATVNPGFVLMMSIWYTSAEQPLRLEIYYSTNGVATMFGGLIGYAVGHIKSGLQKWMYVFLIFGSISIVWGIVSLIVLPDLPSTAKFLTERERLIAVNRVAANRQGVKNHHFSRHQAIQTFQDPKTYILFIMAVGAQVPNSALTSFTSIVVGSFGFDTLGTQYLQIPGGAIQFVALITGGYICTRWPTNTRCATMVVANTICIIGAGLLVGLPSDNKWGRLVALWLCYFQSLGFSLSLTMVSSNVAGYTKKQLTGAILFTGYCVGNIIGPQTFIDAEKPGYHSAYIAMLVGYSIKLSMVFLLYAYMYTSNKKRDREQAERGTASDDEEREAIERGMLDVTELDNRGFSEPHDKQAAGRSRYLPIPHGTRSRHRRQGSYHVVSSPSSVIPDAVPHYDHRPALLTSRVKADIGHSCHSNIVSSRPSPIRHPEVLLSRMPQQAEVRVAEDDWTGSTDAAERRKRQNRLHQRKYRKKMKELKMLATSPGLIEQGQQSMASLDDITPDTQYTLPTALHGPSQPSESQYRHASSTPGIPASQVQGVIARVEDSLSQHYIVSSPRVDLLLTLIQFNVFRALVSNTYTLGFPFSWLSAEADSPYYLGESRWCCPDSLQPTALQRKVPHHPWIDLFPFPALRDNILSQGEDFDDDDLCYDLVEVCHAPSERSGLIVWSDPWDPLGWEATTEFISKWGWMLRGCPELLFSTNYWREKRSEEAIVFDVTPLESVYS
ncbi:hypothetical protein V490_09440 [Pseudogymnoascus sp. VKM F-3557]|nr:hypothetical protein V490_09440 [Pseudogymnoascus sp. VKM F-3557]